MEHPIAEQIIDLLKEHGFWYETFNHESVRTSEEAAALRDGYTLRQGAKAIIIRAKIPNEGKKFVMLVMPADQKFDSGKVKQLLHSKDIRFATEEEVETITKGVKPSGVPPFGNLFGLEVVSDTTLYTNEKIVFNAGRTTSIGMKSEDYKTLVKPRVAEIIYTTKPRIGIIGGGAVGLTYAAFLAPVANVIVKTHSRAQADGINKNGISLTVADETGEITGVTATASMADLHDCDAVIVALKSYDTEIAAQELAKVIPAHIPVISLQNGLQAYEVLKSTMANPARVFAGVTYIGAKRTDERSVSLGVNRRTVIDGKAGPILETFAKTRFGIEASDNIRQAVWDKLVLNNGQNALSAVTDMSVQQMLELPECIDTATHLLSELEAVGKAEGLAFEYSLIDKLKDNWSGGLDFYPSMWQDLHAGKRTEIDAINGAISKLGKRHSIATPCNDMITSLVKALEDTHHS